MSGGDGASGGCLCFFFITLLKGFGVKRAKRAEDEVDIIRFFFPSLNGRITPFLMLSFSMCCFGKLDYLNPNCAVLNLREYK